MTFVLAACFCAGAAAAGEAGGPGSDGGAMRVYRDPATGALGAPAPSAPVDEALPASGSAPAASEAPLVAEPVEGPAGGIKVNLHGRFQAAVRREVRGSEVGPYECIEPGAAAHE